MLIAILFFALHNFFSCKPVIISDTLIISSADIRYISPAGKHIIIPVQLRTKKYFKCIDKEKTCYTYGLDTASVTVADNCELVINPGLQSEFIIDIGDNEFVNNTLHDGKLYTDMFEKNNGYDKLFLYFFTYGSCSNECAIIYYYDINRKKLYQTKFKYDNNKFDDCICLNRKEGSELNKTKSPYNKLKTITFAQGVAVWHHNIWKFDRKTKTFKIYKYKKIAPWG